MAADKEIIAQIRKIESEAPGAVLGVLLDHIGDPLDNPGDSQLITALAEALGQWVISLKAQAALWERSGAKGAKGRAADLLLVAGEVAALANALRDGPTPPAADPLATPAPPPPNGRPLADRSGLDALIADSVAQHRGEVGERQPDGSLLTRSDEVTAYLAGVIDELPGPPLGPSTVTNTFLDLASPTTGAVEVIEVARGAAIVPHGVMVGGIDHTDVWAYDQRSLREKQVDAAQVPVLGQAGSNANDYDTRYVPPGGTALTFADLLTPIAAAYLPSYLSHSQINTVGDCAAKYRMQRVAALPQIPQWANIGGSTLHAAIEGIERMIIRAGFGIDLANYDTEVTWKHHFEEEVARVAATSPVPEVRWRSSRRGAEGRTWWEVNGPLMLRRYLDARPAEPTADLPEAPLSTQRSAIEYEITADDIPTPYGPIPFVAKIDRVTVNPNTGTLTIRDYKSSYERPTDITQLGEYAWALRFGLGVPEHVKIMGTYFDARRGEWTEPVDLAEAYPFEAFQYRLTVAHAQKLALTTGPTAARPSSYCGGCPVRYACPVMALKR